MAQIVITETPGNGAIAKIEGSEKEITELLFNVADRENNFGRPLLAAAWVYIKLKGFTVEQVEELIGKKCEVLADEIILNRKKKA